MSATVCGSKRSYFFDDLPSTPPLNKKLRCGSSSPSPVQLSPSSRNTLLDHLKSQFPYSDPQLLERALEECGNDLDSAVKSLQGIPFGTAGEAGEVPLPEQGSVLDNRDAAAAAAFENSPSGGLPIDGAQWVDLFVREMMSATSVDDVKFQVSRLLESLEKSISSRVTEEAVQGVQKENPMLKEQMEVLLHENSILKKAVAIQHERQKGFEEKDRELHHLKQMVSQYQEQVRTLEVNNYALRMHLRQAEQSSPIPGRFNPDVF